MLGCDSDDEILLPGLSASAVMTALQKFDLKSLPLRSKVMRCRSLMYFFITILNNVDRLVTRDELAIPPHFERIDAFPKILHLDASTNTVY